ncbi:MAG TPA: hypothetical protein VH638_08500 [Gemmatimonadaceae bacterium]
MRGATLGALAAALVAAPMLPAQERGPTVAAARAAVFVLSAAPSPASPSIDLQASCGSALKNAALLGLGLSLATAVLELTYTIAREPFVRNGHDLPAADPALIAWAGGAGFVIGLVGTEVCRRRRR